MSLGCGLARALPFRVGALFDVIGRNLLVYTWHMFATECAIVVNLREVCR